MGRISHFTTGLSIAIIALCGVAMLLLGVPGTGWKALSIPTGSMQPAIPTNSMVLTHRVPVTSLKVGDVVTYINPQNSQMSITHRIVKTYKIGGRIPGFVTKGDANKVADPAIAGGAVVGKVVWHLPHAGAWLLWSKGWVGLIALVYLPALLLMAEEVKRLGDYYGHFKTYRLYPLHREPNPRLRRIGMAGAGGLAAVLLGLSFAPSALALLQSNTVALTNNRLSVAAIAPPVCTGTHTNNTNVTVTNTSNQTATSGGASTTGNATSGTATSGNATNNNSSNTSVTITNHC